MRDYKELLNECMQIQHKLRYRAKLMEMAFDTATEFLGELFGEGIWGGLRSASQEEWRASFLKAAEKKLAEQEQESDAKDLQDD